MYHLLIMASRKLLDLYRHWKLLLNLVLECVHLEMKQSEENEEERVDSTEAGVIIHRVVFSKEDQDCIRGRPEEKGWRENQLVGALQTKSTAQNPKALAHEHSATGSVNNITSPTLLLVTVILYVFSQLSHSLTVRITFISVCFMRSFMVYVLQTCKHFRNVLFLAIFPLTHLCTQQP